MMSPLSKVPSMSKKEQLLWKDERLNGYALSPKNKGLSFKCFEQLFSANYHEMLTN